MTNKDWLSDILDELWHDFQLEHTYKTLGEQLSNRELSTKMAAKAILAKLDEAIGPDEFIPANGIRGKIIRNQNQLREQIREAVGLK